MLRIISYRIMAYLDHMISHHMISLSCHTISHLNLFIWYRIICYHMMSAPAATPIAIATQVLPLSVAVSADRPRCCRPAYLTTLTHPDPSIIFRPSLFSLRHRLRPARRRPWPRPPDLQRPPPLVPFLRRRLRRQRRRWGSRLAASPAH